MMDRRPSTRRTIRHSMTPISQARPSRMCDSGMLTFARRKAFLSATSAEPAALKLACSMMTKPRLPFSPWRGPQVIAA